MAHPVEDIDESGNCRFCGDRLSKPYIQGGFEIRRHRKNPDCLESKGRGVPVRVVRTPRKKN